MGIQKDLINQTKHFIDIAAKRFPSCTFKMPYVKFSLTGKTAGQCTLNNIFTILAINYNLSFAKENFETFKNSTVPHEVAHYISRVVYGSQIKPHGKEWKSIMENVFNIPAKRCHSYKLPETVKKNRIECKCNCKTHYITNNRYTRIKKGARYTCIYCKTIIRVI